ncbi:MAG: SRPBCC family protein [Acidimicrobiales bacterium]
MPASDGVLERALEGDAVVFLETLVSSQRHYRFDPDPETVWAAISDTGSYRRWWPWLHQFDAQGLQAGDTWTCVIEPPLPYKIEFVVSIERVVRPRLITARLSGDVRGTGTVEITGDDGGSRVRVVSHLAPANGFLRAAARVALPVVRLGHDWILDSGARQFATGALAPAG